LILETLSPAVIRPPEVLQILPSCTEQINLEFTVVFIAGCDHKRIPYCRDREAPEDLDEERRLFYVAVTRAREKVFFTYARRGRLFGKSQKYRLSPFVKDIEKGLLADSTENKAKTSKPKQEQMKLF